MKKILVIDDDRTFLKSLSALLERAGYAVCTAMDGFEGLTAITREKPDLVVLDIVLPGVGGYEVIHLVRFEMKLTGLPIILLTCEPCMFNAESRAALGLEYLHKSRPHKELIDKVALFLRPSGSKKDAKKEAEHKIFQAFLDHDRKVASGITRIIEHAMKEYKTDIDQRHSYDVQAD